MTEWTPELREQLKAYVQLWYDILQKQPELREKIRKNIEESERQENSK